MSLTHSTAEMDAVTGVEWWRINIFACLDVRWQKWQSGKGISELIPVLRWRLHRPMTVEQSVGTSLMFP